MKGFFPLLCVLLLLVSCREEQPREISQPVNTALPKSSALKLQVPAKGAYTGAYIDFGEKEDSVTLEAIEKFDALVGKQQAIVGFSNDWDLERFPKEQIEIVASYGALPLIYWLPWSRELQEFESVTPKDHNRFNLDLILAGKWDQYIDQWAEQAREIKYPLLVAWGIEMNGNWFPWCGIFYGAGETTNSKCATCFKGPEKYKAAYRYIVERVRKKGATNVLWVWHVNNTSDPEEPWNTMSIYYPGSDYVDWIAMSAYGQQYPKQDWVTLDYAFKFPYEQLKLIDKSKPLMLAEWGIGEFPKSGDKALWLKEAFSRLETEFGGIKAMVFWHERWQNSDLLYSNLRVNSSERSVETYRRAVSGEHWLARPMFEPKQ